MEKTDDYVSVLQAVGDLESVLSTYPSTLSLNNHLITRTDFRFPILTNVSLQDIVTYYLHAIEVDQPDDAEYDDLHVRLGKFIESGFVTESTLYERAVRELISERYDNKSLSPTSEYIIYLFRLIYERDGPWTLSWHADAVSNLEIPWIESSGSQVAYSLFSDYGLSDALAFCAYVHVPNRAQLIESMTDKAARSFKYHKWLSLDKGYGPPNMRIGYLCYLLTIAKLIRYLPSRVEFRKRFRTYAMHWYDSDEEPIGVVTEVFDMITMLCGSRPARNDGIDFTHYLQYMAKALAYTELVYGVLLLDILGKGNRSQLNALKMLSDAKL